MIRIEKLIDGVTRSLFRVSSGAEDLYLIADSLQRACLRCPYYCPDIAADLLSDLAATAADSMTEDSLCHF